MNEKKQIVCIGIEPWSTLPHRTQQLFLHMDGIEILYFSPPHDQMDTVSFTKKRVKSNLLVYMLPKVNMTNSPIFFSLRQKKLAQFITRIMAKHHVRNPLLWVTHPSQIEMTSLLKYSTLVYDCFEPWQEEYFAAQESLLRKADLIFTASHNLKKQALEYNRNVALLENGVDYSLFEEASLFSHLHEEEMRFGFAGVIDYDLDLSPLLYMAERRPQWKFMLLGPCPSGNPYVNGLMSYKNVEFYGEHSLLVVPEFLLSCHVLMEFRYCDGVIHDINSIRMYEYFATGRPIVTQLWKEEVERFPDVVYISQTSSDYLKNCQIALSEHPNLVSQRRKKYAKDATWQKRSEQILKVLSTSRLMYE